MESELTLLGLLVFSNPLKDDSSEVVSSLCSAGLECKMISGDNLLTCVETGLQAKILKEASESLVLIQFDHSLLHFSLQVLHQQQLSSILQY